MNSPDCSPDPAKASVKLILAYLPPSQLVYAHWREKCRDKKRAMIALSWALSCSVAEFSTKTTLTPLQNRLQTAFAKSVLFLTTRRSRLTSESRRKESLTAMINALKSR